MEVPARLKWRKEDERFVAYPTATDREERFASVRLYNTGWNTDRTPHKRFESWLWMVKWEGWFYEHGFWDSKQGAADKATEVWWTCVQTEPPRDVDMEVAMIVARALVRPVPNSLFSEDAQFLQKVTWHLHQVYKAEIAAGEPTLENLSDQLSAELFRRREAGEYKEAEPYQSSPTFRRRRRRKRWRPVGDLPTSYRLPTRPVGIWSAKSSWTWASTSSHALSFGGGSTSPLAYASIRLMSQPNMSANVSLDQCNDFRARLKRSACKAASRTGD